MKANLPDSGLAYHIYTFGCQMNEHDTEVLAGMLENLGYLPADNPRDADLIVINTCAVRRKPEQKVAALLGKLRLLKQENPNLMIVIGGCMPQQEGIPAELARRFEHIDLIFGTHALPYFPRLLEQARESRRTLVDTGDYTDSLAELPIRRASRFKAWLPVIYGCNNYCSYCIVPYVRGREQSRPREEIVAKATALAREGYLELSLLGQNVNSYGQDLPEPQRCAFADLLVDLDRIEGISRIRFLTSHPKDLSTRLIETVRDASKACEHFHLPVQSGSDRLLKEMHRQYTRGKYLELIEEIKQSVSGVAITTDIIVGYPGETERDFLQTLDLVEKVRFDSAFVFLYSPRKGTRAAKSRDNISQAEKKERFQEILKLQNRISLEINSTLVDSTAEVLVEGASKRNSQMQSGRTRTNKLVHFPSVEDLSGKLVKVPIVEAYTWHLIGEKTEIKFKPRGDQEPGVR